jgi:hypothetical protein
MTVSINGSSPSSSVEWVILLFGSWNDQAIGHLS